MTTCLCARATITGKQPFSGSLALEHADVHRHESASLTRLVMPTSRRPLHSTARSRRSAIQTSVTQDTSRITHIALKASLDHSHTRYQHGNTTGRIVTPVRDELLFRCQGREPAPSATIRKLQSPADGEFLIRGETTPSYGSLFAMLSKCFL